MRTATCDPEAFYPLRRLVSGPFDSIEELAAIERLVRTVLLHDEMLMELSPLPDDPETEAERELRDDAGQWAGRIVIAGIGPILTGYDFFTDRTGPQPVPDIELTAALIETASRHANADEGNVYFNAHIEFLKRVLGIVEQGGSALLCGDFGQQAITTARRYPELRFQQLDQDWQHYARQIEDDGLGLLIPPVLGVVLTRCARRDAIPTVIRDLREEWAGARKKVWHLLDALRTSRTLAEAVEIRKGLADASRLFCADATEVDTRPVRVLWEILAAAVAGAGVAALSGGNPAIGAATNTLGQVARAVPALAHEFGAAIFGRGAFDLARKVRRAVSQVELDALPRLLTEAERRGLGFS